MAGFAIRRLASMLIVLVTLTAVMFLLQRISPVDPVRASVGENASKEIVEKARRRLGYDEPIVNQYFTYVGDVATGNLQTSLRTHEPVADNIRTYLPASLELVVAAIIIATPLALLFGLSGAARWRGTAPFRLGLLGLAAGPSFVLALLGILLFYKQLGWLPASGRTSFINLPTGPTGSLFLDSLIHGELNLTLKHHPAHDPARGRPRRAAGGRGRTCPPRCPDLESAGRPRARRGSQGDVEMADPHPPLPAQLA